MFATVVMCCCFGLARGAAEDLDAGAIMERQVFLHGLDHETEIVELHLVKKSGKSKMRLLERYSLRTENGLWRMLAVIVEPDEVRGTGVLLVENEGAEDDHWLYMPALGKVKQLRASDRKSKFMGTDFCYGDLRADDLAAMTYNLVGEEEVEGRMCFVVEARPATPEEEKATGYSKRIFWISKDVFFVLKVEFYDTRGRLKKVLENRRLVQVSETAWRADEMEMRTVKNGHRSIMKTVSRSLDTRPGENLFTVDGLKSFAK